MATKKLNAKILQLKKDVENFGKKDKAISENYVQTRIKLLEELWESVNKIYDDFLESDEVGEKDVDADAGVGSVYEQFRENYCVFRAKLFDSLQSLGGSSSSVSKVVADKEKEVRKEDIHLPAIKLPSFDGSYQNWPNFHDLFVSLVASKDSLSDIQKMHYLKTSLTGDAEKLLLTLSTESRNYAKGWSMLKDRYDHPRVLVNIQLNTLFNLPSLTQERVESIKDLLYTSTQVIHSLANLKIEVEHLDPILIFLLVRKLPGKTQQMWEEKLNDRENPKQLPTFQEFTSFLETRFRTLEAVDQQHGQSSSNTSRSSSHKHSFIAHAQSGKSKLTCKICLKNQHAVRKCYKFLKMSVTDRSQVINKLGLCRNCLGYSHTSDSCPSGRRCFHCQQPHHTLLHVNNTSFQPSQQPSNWQQHANNSQPLQHQVINNNPPNQVQQNTQSTSLNAEAPSFQSSSKQPSTSSNLVSHHSHHSSKTKNSQVLLATALVKVKSSLGEWLTMRALLDSGSEASFITEYAAQLLQLKSQATQMGVSGLGLVSSGKSLKMVDITFASHHSTFATTVQAYVLKSLTGHLPARTLHVENWTHLNDYVLADPEFFKSSKIDILLGSDVLAELLLPELIPPTDKLMPVMQNTTLGWILFGKAPIVSESSQQVRSFLQILQTDLRIFWELEEAPFKPYLKAEDVECENHFINNVQRTVDGRYQVALPFKGNVHPVLGDSYQSALRRFYGLERRLDANQQLRDQYSECIEEYIQMGHMSEVDKNSLPENQHYFLPHHAVIKESSSTTKLRVVFDASAKTSNGISLNDAMLVGPALQQNICDIILRWRLYKYTFTADIEKMYRQILIAEQDKNYQLVLWRKNTDEPIKVYRLNTVTFGTAAAPYLAIRTLQKLADDNSTNQITSSMILNEMYVDDLISGGNTVAEAKEKIKQIKSTLETAGFNLRKWTSNSDEVLSSIPTGERESSFSMPPEDSERVKTLGVHWLPSVDKFSFCYNPLPNPQPTKRFILSTIARLFDPMGWIAPCIVKAKMFMQQLWAKKLSWDEQIESSLLEQWNVFYNDLIAINKIQFPRWVETIGDLSRVELHGFSDASEKAYGAAVYLRVEDDKGQAKMHLLIAKSRVAPVQPVSLPRLELCGAVMLAQLLDYATQVLGNKNIKQFAWTDSTITLSWIRASPTKWETFVRNRVGEIQRLTPIKIWKHIPTQHNPADLVSRGVLPSDLLENTLWWNGPDFLCDAWVFQYPTQPLIRVHQAERIFPPINELMHRSSEINKLIRITGLILRFTNNSKNYIPNWKIGPISPSELDEAAKILVKIAQLEMFPEGIMKSRGMASLNPFVDPDGIIRVGGRLKNANLHYDQQHPIILAPNHHFTKLILHEAHEKTLHGGIQLMMGYLRKKYWIFQTKRIVKQYIHKCTICYRFRTKPAYQLMGELPSPRVNVSRPFSHTGVDYAGPISIRAWKGRGAKTYKGYLAIFVCLATKAIHLEAVSDLTTQAFLAAFRRFTSRRGVCGQIYSDCGTNFKGAESELYRLLKDATHDWKNVAEALSSQGTKWNFIPPASPHFGGLWEAGVKSVKHHFKRVVGNGTLTFEELTTLLTQIEACLNSRPLCPLTENPDDFHALTPAHFLIGAEMYSVPEPDLTIGKTSYTDRWKAIQFSLQTFWHHWQSEYLARLQQRPKWLKSQPQLKIGDLVLIKDERLPPTKWNLGRILETFPGKDDITRVVNLKTQQGEFKRPVTKLCPLPINENQHNLSNQI
ncbi:uncharacterized protein LOC129911111 [Episyrphus balteatus]|uniref:uncharacterized protein LOC129911111 n=1 Tax=Episyrphus balteatus TaxID=286459 RepID=UPI0024867A61|nr:uncharacterized protein LOC129911111 [Episyrphus balteatus]